MNRILRILAILRKLLELLPAGSTLTTTPPEGVAATVEESVPEDKLAKVEEAVDDLRNSIKKK